VPKFRCTKAFRLVQLKHLPVDNMVVRGQQGQYLDEVGGLVARTVLRGVRQNGSRLVGRITRPERSTGKVRTVTTSG